MSATLPRRVAPPMQALIAAGRQAREQGDYSTALNHFEAAGRANPRHVAPMLELGETLRRQGQLDAAETQYRAVLARDPQHTQAQLGLGRCALARRDDEAALAWFAAAAPTAGANPWPHLEAAGVHRRLGRLGEAEASYRLAAAIAPNLPKPLAGLAACARARHDRATALTYSRAACDAAPDQIQLRVELAEDLRELDRLDEAELEIAAALAREPEHHTALMGAAHLARRQGQLDQALQWLERAQAADGEKMFPVIARIAIHRELGDEPTARALAGELLARLPDHFGTRIQLGLIERQAGRHPAALAEFQAAHDLDPGNIEALLQMAVEHRTLGDQARCDALLNEAVARDQSGTQALLEVGRQAIMANDFVSALTFFERAIATGRARVNVHTGAAEALARLGRMDEAMAVLDAAEALSGSQAATLKRIALLRETGRLTEALAAARAAIAATPGLFSAQAELFRLLMLTGPDAEIDECLAAIRPATQLQHAQLAAMRGAAAEDRGEFDLAASYFRQAVALRPQDAGFHQALARACILQLDFAAATEGLRQYAALMAPANRLQRRSLNPMRSHFGQMINEYRIDADAIRALESALETEPAARTESLLAVVREFPDNTLVAVALITALWQIGALGRQAATPPQDLAVPRRIVQFWDTPEVPAEVQALMATWPAGNPGYEYLHFDDPAAERLLKTHYPKPVLLAYERSRQPAQRADLFRLAYLNLFGGIYIDADDRCLGSLEALIPQGAGLVLYREPFSTLGNNFLAVVPGHKVIRAALNQAVTAVNRGDTETLWFATGPGLITRAFAQEMAHAADPWAFLAGVKIWERRDMAQAVAMHCLIAYKKTKLHWQNTAFGEVGREVGKPGGMNFGGIGVYADKIPPSPPDPLSSS